MAQDDQLLPWASAMENVTIPARLRGARAVPDRATALLVDVGLAAEGAANPPSFPPVSASASPLRVPSTKIAPLSCWMNPSLPSTW